MEKLTQALFAMTLIAAVFALGFGIWTLGASGLLPWWTPLPFFALGLAPAAWGIAGAVLRRS